MNRCSIDNKRWLPVIGLASALVATTLTACTAAAFGKPSLAIEVQSAVSSGNVIVQMIDGTAMLTGRVQSAYDAQAAGRAAARYKGVERVINRIYVVR